MRVPSKELGPLALGHASDDADDQPRFVRLPFAQFAQSGPNLLLGMLTNRAGVVEDHVGLVAVVHLFVSMGAELPEDQLAVEHVHLAAEGFQVEVSLHGTGRSYASEREVSC